MRVFTLLFFALGVLTPCAAQESDPFSPERLETFRESLGEILRKTETPGLGVVVVTREKVIWSGGVGVEDKISERPVTEGTIFRIGSITKSFVALSAMMLVEEAKLDLQTPLRELAPEIAFTNRWEESDPVRIVHLMEHTTGWDDLAFREYAHNVYPPISLREGLDFDPRSRTSRWPPGRSVSYCNSGPPVAAYVIQKITGQDFEEFVRERIFEPLDMPTTTFRGDGTTSLRMAAGYRDGKRVEYWNLLQRPAGAINSSPREMANYLRFFLNEGELDGVRLVKPESIDRMMEARTPRAVKAGVEQWYGLHIGRRADHGQVWYGHTGGMKGYRADMSWCPALGVGYVIMLNSSGDGFGELRSAFREFLTEGHEPVPEPPGFPVAPGALEALAGYYLPITPRSERGRFVAPFTRVVRVRAGSDRLELATLLESKGALVPVGERLFRRPNEHLASAVFYSGEDDGEASLGTGDEYRRVSPLFVWAHWALGGGSILLMASTILFALVWIPRLLFGRKLVREPFLSVRVLPLLSSLFLAAATAFVVTGQAQAIERFGKATPWSVGFMVTTILFAITAVAGLCVAFSAKRSAINRGVRWHGLLSSGVLVVLALYLAAWGVIGLQSWA